MNGVEKRLDGRKGLTEEVKVPIPLIFSIQGSLFPSSNKKAE
jgi:hypothetical protein